MTKIRRNELFSLSVNCLVSAGHGNKPEASRWRIALRQNLAEALQIIDHQWVNVGQPDSFFVDRFNAQWNHVSDYLGKGGEADKWDMKLCPGRPIRQNRLRHMRLRTWQG